ncbi:MAG: hypothetical protein JWO33_840 [Caulobacteraceae bacterium]|nr:hypothetical protein [Caulobacteraceae bacterium]
MPVASQAKSFLITTWEGGGSVAPALTVARKLVERGHRVRVMSDLCNRPEAEATGAEFVAWTRAPSRSDRNREGDLLNDWATPGPEGLMRSLDQLWAGRSLDYALDLVEELDREPADLVATSEMLFGVAAACEARGQPHVLLCAQVSLLPHAGVPPLGPGLPPATSPAEEAMHAEIGAGLVDLLDHGLPAVNATRRHLGLEPLAHLADQADAAEAVLLGTARAFDFAPATPSSRVRYVGPQLDQPAWAEPWVSPWPVDDARPLVMVGFSTTFQNHGAVLQRIADALGQLPVRGLITLGDTIYPSEIQPPPNVALVHSARHDLVMEQAAVVVTHGGHGTVTRALAHRLPMLVIPHGRDQNDNAIRVTWRGAGLSLTPDASAEDIRAALARLLDEPAFAQAARALGDQVAAEIANSPVVEELETLAVSAREPCAA